MIKGIRQSKLESIQISVPDLKQQQEVANKLRTAENLFIDVNPEIRSVGIFNLLVQRFLGPFYSSVLVS